MKTSIKTIILAAASIFAAMSCQKEAAVPETQSPQNAGETIQVNINASLGDLVAADGTKATAESVIRLKWAATDNVDAYCGTTKLNTNPITVTPSENGMFAKLSGEITATSLTSGTSVITFVYSNVANSAAANEAPIFDFSNQGNDIPFVAYATLVYDGTATLANKMVEFKFVTSVMKIAATNLGGGNITGATISGINTKVTLTPDDDSETCGISGDNKAGITTSNYAASSDGTRAIVTVGLVPDNNKGRNITVTQTGFTNKGVITSAEIKSSTSYTTPAALFTCGTLGSGEKVHDYVLIAGTKWATMNVGATEITGTNSYGKYFAWGDIVGQTWNGSSWSGGGFSTAPSIGNPKMLPLEKDAANVLYGDPWRMPTSAEFKALKEATYWAWDGTDKGYYVYAPKDGDAGKVNDGTGSYTKTDALLFFPAAGYGIVTSFNDAGSRGSYWSSSLYADGTANAYYLYFRSDNVNPQNRDARCAGFSVRPVSD